MRLLLAVLLTLIATNARADDVKSALADLRHAWAKVYYQTPKAQQLPAFPALTAQADAIVTRYPQAAEPLIVKAVILSSYAERKGGLDALPLVETARDSAMKATQLDDQSQRANAYTVLGVLYYKVPGWPVGFGNDKKAKSYLDQARAIAPDDIDVNYFTGDFMIEQGDKASARTYLQKALQAAPRPGREDEDAGRRMEIQIDLAKLD